MRTAYIIAAALIAIILLLALAGCGGFNPSWGGARG